MTITAGLANRLYYGDNLSIMQSMPKHSVDLIYLDPPFNSKRNYNLMYKSLTGRPVPEQVEAFCDTWELDAEKEYKAKEIPLLMKNYGIENCYVQFWQLWADTLRPTQPYLLAYLIYMVERLLYMREILRPTGSIYLHCDPAASHYIKVMMDGIFGYKNFRNEIVWKRTTSTGSSKSLSNQLPKNHDIIFFYTKSKEWIWHQPAEPYSQEYLKRFKWKDDRGYYRKSSLKTYSQKTFLRLKKENRLIDPIKPGAYYSYKQFLHESRGEKLLDDVWINVNMLNPMAKERLGYPTQKPIALLDRIIQASSNEGDVIFDPFCGCGTTIYSAAKNNRRWIGCDIAILPIKLIKHVLEERYRLVEKADYEIEGIPISVEQADELFHHDPFQFQHWVIERLGGFPMHKKVSDRGVDGRIYFETKEGLKDMVLSVKGGGIHPTDIRDLRGVLEREQAAQLAGFISIKQPTKAMRSEAAAAGYYEYNGNRYEKIQLLTVHDILEGKKEFRTPIKIKMNAVPGQLNLSL